MKEAKQHNDIYIDSTQDEFPSSLVFS